MKYWHTSSDGSLLSTEDYDEYRLWVKLDYYRAQYCSAFDAIVATERELQQLVKARGVAKESRGTV